MQGAMTMNDAIFAEMLREHCDRRSSSSGFGGREVVMYLREAGTASLSNGTTSLDLAKSIDGDVMLRSRLKPKASISVGCDPVQGLSAPMPKQVQLKSGARETSAWYDEYPVAHRTQLLQRLLCEQELRLELLRLELLKQLLC